MLASKIKDFVTPPIFEDERKTHRARLLHTIMLMGLAVLTIPLITFLLVSSSPLVEIIPILAAVITIVAVFMLLQKGYVQAASVLLTSLAWIIVVVSSIFFGGVRGMSFNFLVIPILCAGLLLGWRTAITFMGLSIAAGLGLLFAHLYNILPISFDSYDNLFIEWVIRTILFILTTGLIYAATQSIQNALKQARKNAIALAEERNLLRTLIDNMPDYIYIKDREGRFVECNIAAARSMSANFPHELTGKTDFDVHPYEFAARYHSDEQAIINTETSIINREEQAIAPSGDKRWHSTIKVPLKDNQNQIIGLVGITRDITKRKQVEEELRKHQEQLEELVEARTAELKQANEQLQHEIQERKKTEQTLQQERDFAMKVMNALGQGIAVTDSEGRFEFVNPAIARLLGYDNVDELLGKRPRDFTLPEDQAVLAQARRDRRKGYTTTYEHRLKRTDGSLAHVLATGVPRWQDSKVAGTIAIITDLTERKQAEEALQRRDAILQTVTFAAEQFLKANSWEDCIQDVLARLGKAINVSRAYIFENQVNNQDVLLSSQRFEWVAPGITPQIDNPDLQGYTWDGDEQERWKLDLSQGKTVQSHVSKLHGEDRDFLLSQDIQSILEVPIFIDQHWWGFIGFDECLAEREWSTMEVDALKTAAATLGTAIQRNQTEKALRDSEERFRAIFEQAAVGIAILGPDGKWLRVNQKLCEIVGYSQEELVNMTFADITYPDILELNLEYMRQLLNGEIQTYKIEKRYIHKSKFLIWVNVTVFVVYDPTGKPSYLIAIVEDITERKRLEEQLRQSQKLEAIGRLAGGIAHDFNNILTVIIGNSELALMTVDHDHPLYANIEQTRRMAERAASLTRQLLAFSRQQILQPAVLNLNSVITNIEEMLRRLIGDYIELETTLDPNLGRIKSDPGQIEQVLLNLAINARDVMPHGGKITIKTANVHLPGDDPEFQLTHDPGPYVMLTVSDTGPGIDDHVQPHIFEPFFTTKEVGQGTGLGLASVHGIIEQSGGYIRVYSEPGQGTTFKIMLPQADYTDKATDTRLAPTRAWQGSGAILLVEDEEGVRKLAFNILKKYGYKVLEASNGQQAVQLLEQQPHPIDLLLTDVMMPGGLSGPQLAKQIATTYPQIKVLYMSGYNDDLLNRQGILIHDAFFIRKPFTPDELTQKIRQILDQD